jgi:tetratricopeptide (TPR) repeat protein
MDETDLFFNLRLGEIVLHTHHVPLDNRLSFTFPDARDVNLAWLFQIVLALVYRAGGIQATVLLKTAFVAGTFAVLWRVGRRRGAAPALLAMTLALAAWAAEPRFVERPHLVTFLGLALALLALERAEAGRPRALWALVPGGFVWANGNSCFFLAPALLLLYAAGALADRRPRDARRAALVAVALAPIVLATPSGAGALGYIANHFRMPMLRPLQEYRVAAWPVDGPFFFLLAALVAAMALAPRGRWRTFLPALALAALGARRIRFVAEFALLAGPAVAAALTAGLGRIRREASAGALPAHPLAAALAGVVLVALTVIPRAADARAGQPWFDVGLASGLVPTAAIRFAEDEDLRERMYNDLEVGSYLTWDGWPRYRVFQDPRINGYPPELHAVLRRADLTRTEWQAQLDRFGVTSALITYPAVNPRGALFDPARWALVYRSNEALIFARRTPGRASRIARLEIPLTFRYDAGDGLLPEALRDPPVVEGQAVVDRCHWDVRLGDFYVEGSMAEPRPARAAYRKARGCLDEARRATLAGLEMELGDAAAAERLWATVSGSDASVARGFALLRLGRAEEALAALNTARDANADAVLGRALALETLHRDAEAAAALREFLVRAPDHIAARDAKTRLARLGQQPPGRDDRLAPAQRGQ